MTRVFAFMAAVAMCVATADAQMTASVAGHVSAATTGRPVSGALLTLRGAGISRTLSSEGSGAFTFPGLPPGEYDLTVSHPGFLDATYGQQVPGGPSALLSVSAGHTVTVNLALWRGGAISGRVVDETGEPLVGIEVDAYRVATGTASEIGQVDALSYPSNDIGEFRIAKLLPGRYFVAAKPAQPDGTSDARSWFPGTPDETQARGIDVRLGQEVTDVDFAALPSDSATVSGVAVLANGQRVSDGTVTLVRNAASSQNATRRFSTGVRRGGTFAIPNVPPGMYTLFAQSHTRTAEHGEFLRRSISVTGSADLGYVQLRRAARVRGRVAGAIHTGIEGIIATQQDARLTVPIVAATVGADGAFDVLLSPGR